jgi:hypothetical protein
VCDADNAALKWIREKGGVWKEELLAKIHSPARAEVFTNRASGRLEIVVACQERIGPTDEMIGSVTLLRKEDGTQFTPVTVLSNMSRIASVEPGDFNHDGETDFVVAAFGYITTGEVGWLREKKGHFSYRTIVKRSGAIRARPGDLNRDGFLDFVALFGQEHEQISAFLNDGKASFKEATLFKAMTPSFGSSGIELADLDQDGDIDILYTNGDNMDLASRIPRPYHGVQWLENRGDLNFVYHDIFRFYGAYCAVPADLDQDSDIDIVVTSLFNDWDDPERASLVWLENDGQQQYIPRGMANRPTQLISAAVGDLNQDGRPDVIASGMHIFPPFDRMGRVSLWTQSK